jgi:hypothetical protein
MTHANLYHYTYRMSAQEIGKSGRIQAQRCRVYMDMVPNKSRSFETMPIVWLTINPILDAVVLTKLTAAGWGPKSLSRVKLPYICDVGLGDFVEASNYVPSHFNPMVETGHMVGSDYTTWRIFEGDLDLSNVNFEVELDMSWLEKG